MHKNRAKEPLENNRYIAADFVSISHYCISLDMRIGEDSQIKPQLIVSDDRKFNGKYHAKTQC